MRFRSVVGEEVYRVLRVNVLREVRSPTGTGKKCGRETGWVSRKTNKTETPFVKGGFPGSPSWV